MLPLAFPKVQTDRTDYDGKSTMAKADLTNKGKARAWQRMLSGRRLDLLDPSPLDVEITDIAHGLARVARWNGQTHGENAYSVAQHSLLVEAIFNRILPNATPQQQLIALLHDGSEFVLGDIISPFKAVMGGEYINIEERIQNAIHIRFSLPTIVDEKIRKAIKQADQISAYHEAIFLAGFSIEEAKHYFYCTQNIRLDKVILHPDPTATIEQKFLTRFAALEKARRNKKAGNDK